MNLNAIIPNVYIMMQYELMLHISSISYCIKMHIASLSSNVTDLFMQKTLSWLPNWLTHGKNSVIMNLFSIENVLMFPELITVGVVKWIFCYKEGILMETDPFPAKLWRILNILL